MLWLVTAVAASLLVVGVPLARTLLSPRNETAGSEISDREEDTKPEGGMNGLAAVGIPRPSETQGNQPSANPKSLPENAATPNQDRLAATRRDGEADRDPPLPSERRIDSLRRLPARCVHAMPALEDLPLDLPGELAGLDEEQAKVIRSIWDKQVAEPFEPVTSSVTAALDLIRRTMALATPGPAGKPPQTGLFSSAAPSQIG
jgi:hypothetical protein